MSRRIHLAGLAVAGLLAAAAPAAAGGAPLVRPERGSDFYLRAGVSWLSLDVEAEDQAGWLRTGLDPRTDRWGPHFVAGWAYAAPVRLELWIDYHDVRVSRPGFTARIPRGGLELQVAPLAGERASISVAGGLGGSVINFTGPEDYDDALVGLEATVGASLTLRLFGGLGLEAGYRYLAQRYDDHEYALPGEAAPMRIAADARGHLATVTLTIDP